MASRKPPAGPTPVTQTEHLDKRKNIPTADAQDFIPPEANQPHTLLYPRDTSLDPQLVWRGKDEQDSSDLEVVAPPIFIQEKIDPRVLVENLRRTAAAGESEPELTLFDSFDGLDELANVEFYQHDANWSNRMILGDSLAVMGSLAEREGLRGKVQMIYIDPPYGIKFGSNWQRSARKRDVKDGKLEDATFEAEQIKAFRDTWELGIHSYLAYLRDRLVVARDLLTESGSCFVQIGDENVHLVRSLMDEVFGSENFGAIITVRKTTSEGASLLGSTVDFVLMYGVDVTKTKYRQLFVARSDAAEGRYDQVLLEDGTITAATSTAARAGGRLLQLGDMTSSRPARDGDVRSFTFGGKNYTPGSGTFKTNASGSPHRSLAFAGEVPDNVTATEVAGTTDASSAGFEEMILDNLAKAGIQNGRRNERLTFASVEPYPGEYVQAIGENGTTSTSDSTGNGAADASGVAGTDTEPAATPPANVAITIGPQYSTVGPAFIKAAYREAVNAQPQVDMLAILAFSFDPMALGASDGYVSSAEGFADVAAERRMGRLPVLLVRMNSDLFMGEDLKKTGSGNLFTVFGKPDIEIREGDDPDYMVVEVKGVDVYDPSTGEVRSGDTDLIALWMIDTNYNEESFFVRHAYFTGGNDPYARLKRALKADIDEAAWATLNSTVSRSFPKPDTGKIAVKVINDYGDEVMQVFNV